jgi:hypothetical protein
MIAALLILYTGVPRRVKTALEVRGLATQNKWL